MQRGSTAVFLVAVLSLVPAGVPTAQEGGPKALDGTVWKQLTPEQKALFTLGYATGVGTLAQFAPGPCNNCTTECLEEARKRLVPSGVGIPQVVQTLDQIYTDAANEKIPAQYAIKLASMKAKGVSEEEWKASLEEARQDSAAEAATP
jgi:hypothetical protein